MLEMLYILSHASSEFEETFSFFLVTDISVSNSNVRVKLHIALVKLP